MKDKEKIKDIFFMVWSFLIGGTLFWILSLYSLNYTTGLVIDGYVEKISINFYLIVAPILFLCFYGICYLFKKLKW